MTNICIGQVTASATTTKKTKDSQLWRDLLAFWIFGLSTQYGYVVVLSAAHDILTRFSARNVDFYNPTTESPESETICNESSAALLLLADIMPSLAMNIICPYIIGYTNFRVILSALLQGAGFLLISFAEVEWHAILGVIATSLSLGLGEVTFLAHSSQFNKNVLSTWSSGTGGAGIIGAFSYAALIAFGLSERTTLLLMVFVPTLQCCVFWFLLRSPQHGEFAQPDANSTVDIVLYEPTDNQRKKSSVGVKLDAESNERIDDFERPLEGIKDKLKYMPSLLKYILPLIMVFLFEYIINSGLFEIVHYPNIWLDHQSQYRWFQVVYQVGVFVSRSSGNLIHLENMWWMPFWQFLNIFYFLFEVMYPFTPSIWITFMFAFWVGMQGGLTYVNTFFRMVKEVPATRQNFALAAVTVAESIGIVVAGFIAMPIHDALCKTR